MENAVASQGRRFRETAGRTIPAAAFPRLVGLVLTTGLAMAQDPIPIDGLENAPIHGAGTARRRPVSNEGPGLPIWNYQIVSPVNGLSYAGYMVGTSPFPRGPRR